MTVNHTAESLGLDIAQVDARLEAGRNLPARTYLEPTVHEFELDAIFTDCWQYFAPVHSVLTPGSVVTGTVGRTPVAVVRGDDGELRGFVNACRHRGYQVADDGHCARIQCGYHGWIYGLDGSLLRTGRAEHDLTIVKEGPRPPARLRRHVCARHLRQPDSRCGLARGCLSWTEERRRGDRNRWRPRTVRAVQQLRRRAGLELEALVRQRDRVLPLSDGAQGQLRCCVRHDRRRLRVPPPRWLQHVALSAFVERGHDRRWLSLDPVLPGYAVHPAGRPDGHGEGDPAGSWPVCFPSGLPRRTRFRPCSRGGVGEALGHRPTTRMPRSSRRFSRTSPAVESMSSSMSKASKI